MSRFTGRIAVVTGTTSGIGAGIAAALREEGATVYGFDVDAQPGDGRIACDVADETSVAAAFAEVLRREGRIDHVVANAGVRGADLGAEDVSLTEWNSVMSVNLSGVFLTLSAGARAMLPVGRGSMVAIASMSGNRVVNLPQRTVAYNTAKAGVTAMVRTMAAEWGGRGVRVNTVSPGYVSTPFLDADVALHPGWLSQTVTGRFAQIDEIAAGVLYLLSDAAGSCVGTDLLIDSGYSLR